MKVKHHQSNFQDVFQCATHFVGYHEDEDDRDDDDGDDGDGDDYVNDDDQKFHSHCVLN